MKSLKKNKLIIIFSLIFLFLVSKAGTADEVTLKEALKIGFRTNKDLRNLQKNIEDLKRELTLIRAQQDWQVEIKANYNHNFTDDDSLLGTGKEQKNASLKINKLFASGLQINPVLKISDNNFDPNFLVTLSQQIYPEIPTELDKQYYRTGQNLLKLRQNYLHQKADKILSWLESYLAINRMYTKRDIYIESLKQAKENLNKIQEAEKIGEAGKQKVLTARLSVKEAEYSLQDINHKIEEAKMTFKQMLGLDGEQTLVTDINSGCLTELRENARQLLDNYLKKKKIMTSVAANDYNLYINKIDRQVLKQELEWLKEDGKTDVNLTGSYNTKSDELTAGFNLSYQLYDGKQQELKYKDKEAEIKINRANYNDIYKELKNKLKQYKNVLELSRLQLEKQKICVARNKHELQTARQQHKIGLIDYLEYQKQWIKNREAKVMLSSIVDQIFIKRLQFIKFVDKDKLIGELLNS